MAHVEQRGKTSWRLVVTIGYDEKGVPIRERKTIRAKNKTEAEKQLSIFEAQILTGQYAKPERMTLKDLYNEWDRNVELSPRTKDDYRNVMKKRVLPKYGHMNIADIKPIHVLNFVNELQKDGARLDGKPGKLSSSAISNAYKAFNSVLKFAKTMTWIPKNPAENVTVPTVQHTETDIYTPRELSILANGLEELGVDLDKRVLVAIALSSAARQSEIAALEEKHCDFERGGIHIRQSLTIETGVGVLLKETKTKRTRFVSLPDVVMGMTLLLHKTWQLLD